MKTTPRARGVSGLGGEANRARPKPSAVPDAHQVPHGTRPEARTVRHSPLGDTTHAGPSSSLRSTPASGIQHPRQGAITRPHRRQASSQRQARGRGAAVAARPRHRVRTPIAPSPGAAGRQLKIAKTGERERGGRPRIRGYRRTTTVSDTSPVHRTRGKIRASACGTLSDLFIFTFFFSSFPLPVSSYRVGQAET